MGVVPSVDSDSSTWGERALAPLPLSWFPPWVSPGAYSVQENVISTHIPVTRDFLKSPNQVLSTWELRKSSVTGTQMWTLTPHVSIMWTTMWKYTPSSHTSTRQEQGVLGWLWPNLSVLLAQQKFTMSIFLPFKMLPGFLSPLQLMTTPVPYLLLFWNYTQSITTWNTGVFSDFDTFNSRDYSSPNYRMAKLARGASALNKVPFWYSG